MFIFIQIHIRQELKCWDWNVGPEPRVKLPERSAVLEDWSWNCNWDARRIWKGDMNDSIVFPMRWTGTGPSSGLCTSLAVGGHQGDLVLLLFLARSRGSSRRTGRRALDCSLSHDFRLLLGQKLVLPAVEPPIVGRS